MFFAGGNSKIIHKESVTDDPSRRKPDISRAKQHLNWQPKVRKHNSHILLGGSY